MDESELFPLPASGLSSSGTQERRPPNAYILFCLENRGSFRKRFPDVPNIEISRMLGDEWKSLDESVKLPYRERARDMQRRFKASNPEYKYERARKRRREQEFVMQRQRYGFPEMLSGVPPHLVSSVLLTYLSQLSARREARAPPPPAPAFDLPPQSPDPYFSMFDDPNQ